MDKTLGYILCTQSPGLFLAALMLLLFYFARRREHHVRAVMDLVLCIVCAAGGVALYFVGMGAGLFTIQDFYAIRTPGWVGIGVVVIFNVWLIARGFLAVNRRRTAEIIPTHKVSSDCPPFCITDQCNKLWTLRIREGAPYAELETKPRRRPPLGKRRFSPAALRFRSGSVPQTPAQAFCAGIIVRFDKITVLCGTSFCIIS